MPRTTLASSLFVLGIVLAAVAVLGPLVLGNPRALLLLVPGVVLVVRYRRRPVAGHHG